MPEGPLDFTIEQLGDCRVASPMSGVRFVDDDDRVLFASTLRALECSTRDGMPSSMEAAGPRERIFFRPEDLACGIVTCGGLCPGLNDVIRSIVISLYHHYGVSKVYGFRFGYEGLVPGLGRPPLPLTPASVNGIHAYGGSILGSSRGPHDPAEMLTTLKQLGIGILFAIGGDGTLRGAEAIGREALRQGL